MNRWIVRAATYASMGGALAILPAGVVFAQESASAHHEGSGHGKHDRAHKSGLVHEALKLDSLSADQRSAIEALAGQRRDAAGPVRAADAKVLVTLAQQVEQATLDPQALAPVLQMEKQAAAAERAVERDALNRLHGLLTPVQRNQLVDRIEAEHAHDTADASEQAEGHGAQGARPSTHAGWGEKMAKLSLSTEQKAQIATNLRQMQGPNGGTDLEQTHAARHAALESFRADSFDGAALVRVDNRGERAERLAQAVVPVLTPAQRAMLASELRARAARESAHMHRAS